MAGRIPERILAEILEEPQKNLSMKESWQNSRLDPGKIPKGILRGIPEEYRENF